MLKYKNLRVIGTSHIAVQSINEVKEAMAKLKPDIVALELDKLRFVALVSKRKPKLGWRELKELGLKGFLFNAIGAWVEKKLGKMVGVKPGAEMLTAVKLAVGQKAKIALIDRDIRITIRNLFNYLTWREKFRFIGDIFGGIFLRRNVVRFDLRKVPSDKMIRQMVGQVRKRYPAFYKALVKERDEYMAKNLYNLINRNKDKAILAVVGAGHEDSIISLIKKQVAKGGLWNTQGGK